MFNLEHYNFFVPENLIAQEPLKDRDLSRLLVANSFNDEVKHQTFFDLVEILPPDAMLVFNRSRVIPARIWGKAFDGKEVEVFLLEPVGDLQTTNVWSCIGKPMRRLQVGADIFFEGGVNAKIIPSNDDSMVIRQAQKGPQSVLIRFETMGESFWEWLKQNGSMPLPPYIQRPKKDRDVRDFERYQSVFSDQLGSVAASTASLHFSERLLEALARKGITFTYVTLHVGAGTFFPIKAEDIREHEMHYERFFIDKSTVQSWLSAYKEGKPIVCVGTTSLRAMESVLGDLDHLEDKTRINTILDKCTGEQRTNLFIHPKNDDHLYRPKIASGLITNFHQPESSLFVLVCALMGHAKATSLYAAAVNKGYRFFSYGDACFFRLNPSISLGASPTKQ